MTRSTRQILDEALKLSPDERAVIVADLMVSLERESDPEVEAAWVQEIHERLNRIDSGADQPIPWEEARARLRAKFSA